MILRGSEEDARAVARPGDDRSPNDRPDGDDDQRRREVEKVATAQAEDDAERSAVVRAFALIARSQRVQTVFVEQCILKLDEVKLNAAQLLNFNFPRGF